RRGRDSYAKSSRGSVMAETISLKEKAPGAIEGITKFIEDNTPQRIGFSFAGVDVYANRSIRIEDATLSDDGLATATGAVPFKTGSQALVPASITLDFDIKYNIITRDLENAEISKSNEHFSYTLDLKNIKEVLDGDFSAALELIPNGGLVKREIKSEY